MAYSNSASERMDELRFRNQTSPRTDTSFLGLVSPPRTNNRASQPSHSQDGRGGLMRRFTTDSGRVPTISSITSQRGAQEQEYGPSTYHKVQLLEKKKLEYERLREQKRRFEAEMQLLDLQQRRDEQELALMQEDLSRPNHTSITGHVSEPTTPPEYRESSSGFPSAFSRPNRYSTSSLTSPPGLFTRPGRSGSQLTSPQAGIVSRFMMDDKLPSKSVPGTRRNSDEDEKAEAVRQDPTSHRSTNALNRYSMPVTRSRNGMNEMLALDQTNTARFLFGEDEGRANTPDAQPYLQMTNEDQFPILVRGDHRSTQTSTSSAALDLASPPTTSESNGWGNFNRHRQGQASLPVNTLQSSTSNPPESPISVAPSYRHSLDLKYYENSQDNATSQLASPPHTQATPPKLQSSYSANDVPTMRSTTNGTNSSANTPNTHAQQHLHNHNASLGRIPPNAVNNRVSREMSSPEMTPLRELQNGGYQSIQSALSGNAPPFGPALSQAPQPSNVAGVASPNGQQQYMSGYYNGGYGMQMMTMGMQNMNMGPQPGYSPHNPYAYSNMYAAPPPPPQRDSQARVIQQRRQNDGDAMSRFANTSLESLRGDIYPLCKDQHGCRYLQKKLEERDPEQIHMIWLETSPHVIELMTDPFGNYLCQKLLEYCNDDERTALIENASRDLVRIALNQHGTRALQKMIEFISTPGQIQTIINALRHRVVELIQDLNGNHVIQKCLNKLTPTDAQFIFDAVGHHCVDVGTHRHGCCVLQRCIDHASGDQKAWLIRQISDNAFTLVQDPFGNYVVQYILDLNEPIFTEPLVAMFRGCVGQLSKQKFSSNVIEKCLRCAQDASKDMLIEEMLQPVELERLLRDSFANYVIQTALDYANETTRARLVDAIRPHLPAIRTTPYGRRIQAKITGPESRNGSGQATPSEQADPLQIPVRHQRQPSVTSPPNGFNTTSFTNGFPPSSGINNTASTATRGANQTSGYSTPREQNNAPPSQDFYARPVQNGTGNGNWL